MITTYITRIHQLLETIEKEETEKMNMAAEKIAESLQNGGIIHVFGCGHSNILAEEVYYRAGGLVPIHPIFHEPLMLHEDAVHSSELERTNQYAKTFMEQQDIREHDILIAVSTSGRNPVPIDSVLIAKEKGAFVIGISSQIYANHQSSRHVSGKFLHEVVDLAIDNHVPLGDALLRDERVAVQFGPSSTVVGTTIINSIIGQSVSFMADRGFVPPVLLSGNVDGADQHNKALIAKYKGRIQLR